MLNIKKILLPVDFPVASLGVIRQAATLARHFNSEIVMLHVVTTQSHAAGVPEDSRELADWDLLAAIIRQAQKQQDQSLGPELDGLTIQRKLVKGDAAQQMAKLQQDMGIKADVFIGSGDVPKVLSQAAKQTKADLLITGCYPYGGHLRTHGYGIICAVPVPVLSV